MIKMGRLLNRRILPGDATDIGGDAVISPVSFVNASANDPTTFAMEGADLASLGGQFLAAPGASPSGLLADGLGAGIPAWTVSSGGLVSKDNMDWGGDWSIIFVAQFPNWVELPGGGTDDFEFLVSRNENYRRVFQILISQISDGGGAPTGAEIAVRAKGADGAYREVVRRNLSMASVSNLSSQVLSFGVSHSAQFNRVDLASRNSSSFYGLIDIGSYPRPVTIPGPEPAPIHIGHLSIQRQFMTHTTLRDEVDAAALALLGA